MSSFLRRGLRLGFILQRNAVLASFALATNAMAWPALVGPVPAPEENPHPIATQTTMAYVLHDQGGQTRVALDVRVSSEDGAPAAGAVTLEEDGRQVAGAALGAEGRTTLSLDLPPGDHSLRAVYLGDADHERSASDAASVHAEASTSPDFSVSVAPTKLTLPVGQSGSVVASITPINNSSLTAPMFVTLSCQGLPDQSQCTFTPENLEILPGSCPTPGAASCPIKSTMVIETQLGTGALTKQKIGRGPGPMAWALVLPGALGILGLGWRRRGWTARMMLLACLGLVSMLGATACNARYDYYNHGPPPNPPTPAGTFTLTISAQSNNGITAINHSATMVLTVQ